MARPRTGSLEEREDSFYARLTVDSDVAGTVKRKWFCLNTKDRATAERLVDQLNANESPAPSISPHAAQTVKERAVAWHDARKARGVKQWDSERGWLENHIYPKIGDLPIGTVRPAHIMDVITSVMAKKLSPGTIEHIRSTMHLLFDEAWRLEIIADNPVLKVKVPPIAYVKKPRVILADDEVLVFWSCEDAELEIRMLGVVARCEGGMRTRDCTAWDWTMIDRERFASCIVPRTKTGKPQRLDIPDVLQGPLRAWWERQGCPTSGPVFPVTRGPRKGEARPERGVSFADRLRRNLLLAGVKRHPCQRPDVRPTEKAACCPGLASDPVYKETAWSLPVDFHSLRRAFSTGLAEAGVNAQQAMVLAGHADPRAHALYVMETEKLARIPEAALPQLGRRGFATSFATASKGCGQNLSDFGAGHEIRTRDPQLGNLKHGFLSQGFQQVTDVSTPDESQQIVARRDELPPIATGILAGEPPRRVNGSRATLLVHLADDLRASIVDGDMEAARIAHDAIGRLLGSEQTRLAVVAELPTASASGRASR